MKSHSVAAAGVVSLVASLWNPAFAAEVFTDSFVEDDDVVLLDLEIAASGIYDIRSFGYAGGTTSTGMMVPGGGFDTILTLFDDMGSFITENDDASEIGLDANIDPGTGQAYDAWIRIFLDPGDYQVAVTQYDNYALGDLGDGFAREGEGNFTPGLVIDGSCDGVVAFCDSSGVPGANARTDTFLFEVAPVPVPAAVWLFGSGLLALVSVARRKLG